jgi:hypothetical protein
MKRTIKILQSLIFIGVIITIVGLTTNYSSKPLTKESNSEPCVYISKWIDCSDLCTRAICFKFKNKCSYSVKIVDSTKNEGKGWTKHERYLDPGEESAEAMICPYIEMRWYYIEY